MDGIIKKALAKANNVEKGLWCIVDRSTDADEMNVLACCGALQVVCTSCYYTALAPSPKCPVCTKPLGDFHQFRGAKDAQNDVKELIALLGQLRTLGCRQPNKEAGQQTDMVFMASSRSFTVGFDFLESAFPDFLRRILSVRQCEFSGPQLKVLRTFGLVAETMNLAENDRDYLSAFGLQLYRYCYTVKMSSVAAGTVAWLLAKLGAPDTLVIQAALPDSIIKPAAIVHYKDTAFYASVWTQPFLVRNRNQVARALLDRFGLRSVSLPLDPKKEHAIRGACMPHCWRCKLTGAIRNELRHQDLMKQGEEYNVKCTFCDLMVASDRMRLHVRRYHWRVLGTVICPQCGTATSGQFRPKISHEAECPWRLFPIGPGEEASQGRQEPLPLRIDGGDPPAFPDGEERVDVGITLINENQRRRVEFSWG